MSDILNVLSAIGISAVISTFMSFLFDIKKGKTIHKNESLFNEKYDRYKSLLVFMSVVLDTANYKHINTAYKPNNTSNEDEIKKYYTDEVQLYRKYCLLFADQDVIMNLEKFLDQPSKDNYESVALSMRRDLWNNKIKVDKK